MRNIIPTIIMLFFLTACSAASGGEPATPSTTGSLSTPSTSAVSAETTPTQDPTQYHTVPVQACRVFQAPTIRTLRTQGDLVAWSPVADTLAFLSASETQDQSFGPLLTAAFPKTSEPIVLAPHAAGNLSWAPDGKHIAFAVLRLGEGLYSLQSVDSKGNGLVDFFPGAAARTDEWASPKIVRRWLDDSLRLEMYSSCGVNCAASYEGDVRDGSRKPTGEPSAKNIDLWEMHSFAPPGEAFTIAKATAPNWSPDGLRIVYFDNKSNVWIISKTGKNQFMLDIGKWATPIETKWSADNQYLAIRTDFDVQVFEMNCAPPG
jgi:hypothetical protein